MARHFPMHSELAIEVHKANLQSYVDTIHCGAGVTSSQDHILDLQECQHYLPSKNGQKKRIKRGFFPQILKHF